MLLSAKNVADSKTKRVGFKISKRFLFHLEAYNLAVKQFKPVVTAFGSDLQLLRWLSLEIKGYMDSRRL